MKRGNVLVIGNSGVGKSTLINAVLGENKAITGYGTKGTTNKLEIYESDEVPFRIIDTIGFEPTLIKEQQAIGAVKKWSKNSAKQGNEDNQINVIWFCVEGTSSKLFPKAIQSLSRATAMWRTVPVVVVITKSYAVKDRMKNIEMVQNAFASEKRYVKNLRKIIPVVAETFELNDTAFAPPEGITELIDATNELMPEGIQAGISDLEQFKLKRKRALAQGIIGTATASAAIVGGVTIPFSDGVILAPLEVGEINAIARVYGIENDERSKKLFTSIIEVGTVGVVAKTSLAVLKAIPGINIAGAVLNAIMAGCMVAALGEGTAYIFEQIYLGKKTFDDIDWVTKVLEDKLTVEFIEKAKVIMKELSEKTGTEDVSKLVATMFKNK